MVYLRNNWLPVNKYCKLSSAGLILSGKQQDFDINFMK